MRTLWAILALVPMLILGASGVCMTRQCEIAIEIGVPESVATDSEPIAEESQSCCAMEHDQKKQDTEPANCPMADPRSQPAKPLCCSPTSPLSNLLLCCITPLASVSSNSPHFILKPTLSAFVLPIWEDSHQVLTARAFASRPVLASTDPPPSRPSLCIWVI